LLSRKKEITDSGIRLPDLDALAKWVITETRLGNDNLRRYLLSNYDPDLEKVLNWSEAVNEDISRWLRNIPPFPKAVEGIKKISASADLIIVSQTPLEALDREWEEHKLKEYVRAIAGQEHGTKTTYISLAAKGKYHDNKILMIGDAKGDYDASKNNGIAFYPIIAGKENESWRRFVDEGFGKFIKGSFAGDYEESLLEEFWKSLPDSDPSAQTF
jgi:phosphoglycolate phosphatase-like HAD superfamily hydrolase